MHIFASMHTGVTSIHTSLANTEIGFAIFHTTWVVGQNCTLEDDIKASDL